MHMMLHSFDERVFALIKFAIAPDWEGIQW